MSVRRAVLTAFALLASLASCQGQVTDPGSPLVAAKDGGGKPKPPCTWRPSAPTSLQVYPIAADVVTGGSLQLTVTDQAGVVPACALKWHSSNTAVATVSDDGLVSGVAVGGPVVIKAQTGGKKPLQVTATIAVMPSPTVTSVLGTANVFGYGETTPAPAGGEGGTLGIVINVANVAGSWIEVTATGAAAPDCCSFVPPDGFGDPSFSTALQAVDPISGYAGPRAFMLVGVFIPDGDLSLLTAPAGLPYGSVSEYQLSQYSPGLRQVFFVGDGLTGNNFDGSSAGSRQRFYVPVGASKLVLGFADGYDYTGLVGGYYNNSGALTVTVQQRRGP